MQPHIYTMPEAFLEDESVPARWKVLAVIQGFWIAGKTMFATNDWIAKKLGYSSRQVQYALSELEEMNLITRSISGFDRFIFPGGATQLRGVKSDFVGGRSGASSRDAVGLRHNSVSNSVNKTGETKVSQEIVEVIEEQPQRQRADTAYRAVFDLWGDYPLQWKKNRTEIEAARNLMAESNIEDMQEMLAIYQKFKDSPFCPSILKPSDLDRKWDNLLEFKKKHG